MKPLIGKYQMIARVDDFGSASVDLFPQHTAPGPVLAAIRSARESLAQQFGARVSINAMVRKCGKLRNQSRDTLQTLLASLARTAASVGIDGFQVYSRFKNQEWIDAGRAFSKDAEPFMEELVLHGLSPDFLENVKAAVDGFELAMKEHHNALVVRQDAISRLRTTVADAMKQVGRLESLVLNTLSGNSTVMIAWEAARRVVQATASKSPAPTPASDNAAATPA